MTVKAMAAVKSFGKAIKLSTIQATPRNTRGILNGCKRLGKIVNWLVAYSSCRSFSASNTVGGVLLVVNSKS
jgi:hypothetical protein